jgi:molecular chaperone GrpE
MNEMDEKGTGTKGQEAGAENPPVDSPAPEMPDLEQPGATVDIETIREELARIVGEQECDELLNARQKLDVQSKLLDEKSKLLSEYEDLLKRKQAEFENYRKRMQREFEDNRKYANSALVLDIVNVLDDFERAIESSRSSKDFDTLLEGILLVEKQLKSTLESKYGVERIETIGREFDPTIHDAIMMEDSEKVNEDTVVESFQTGYRMHDRIIRPARVKVARAATAGPGDDPDQEIREMRESSGKGE